MRPIIATVLAVFALTGPAAAQPLQGSLRDEFVEAFNRSCVAKANKDMQANAAFVEKAGITAEKATAMCRCEADRVADTITPDDFGVLFKTGAANDSVRHVVQAAQNGCKHLLRE